MGLGVYCPQLVSKEEIPSRVGGEIGKAFLRLLLVFFWAFSPCMAPCFPDGRGSLPSGELVND